MKKLSFPILLIISLLFNISILNSQIVITVANTTDLVNGDITDLYTLINNPGSDGISLREALYASNNTVADKVIEFDHSIIGETIYIDPEEPGDALLIISQDSLIIDGDLNDDGEFGTPNTATGPGFSIVSSNITIKNLNLINFHGSTIQICCPNDTCGIKNYNNINIKNNTIVNNNDRWGISIGPGGLL